MTVGTTKDPKNLDHTLQPHVNTVWQIIQRHYSIWQLASPFTQAILLDSNCYWNLPWAWVPTSLFSQFCR